MFVAPQGALEAKCLKSYLSSRSKTPPTRSSREIRPILIRPATPLRTRPSRTRSRPSAQDSPPAGQKVPLLATPSPPPGADSGVFRASGGASRRPSGPTRESPATTRVSAIPKVDIMRPISSWGPDARMPRKATLPSGAPDTQQHFASWLHYERSGAQRGALCTTDEGSR